MSDPFLSQPIPQIAPQEFALHLAAGDLEGVQLLDVREPEEVAIASIPGFENLPLSRYADWADRVPTRFDPHVATIVMCHHGIRSAQMCQWLMTQGFTDVKNLAGGIDAYTKQVDPTIPQY